MSEYERFVRQLHEELEYLEARQEQSKRRERLDRRIRTKKGLLQFVRENEDVVMDIILSKSSAWSRSKDFPKKLRRAILDKMAPDP